MNESDLDDRLARLAPTVSHDEAAAARDLAAAPRSAARPSRPRRRRRTVVVGVAGGVLALSGAGSLAAYQLSIPPFSTIPNGIQRLEVAVPIDFRGTEGEEQCRMFLEFSNLTPAQLKQATDFVADTDWTGYGQRIADEVSGAPDSEPAVLDRAGEDLRTRVLAAVPGISDDPIAATEAGEPLFAGHAATCVKDSDVGR